MTLDDLLKKANATKLGQTGAGQFVLSKAQQMAPGIQKAGGMIGSELKSIFSSVPGKIFAGFSLVEILKAPGIFGKIREAVKQVWVLTVGWRLELAKLVFTGKSVLTELVRGTGSLEAAMRRIQRMQGLQRVFAPFVGGAAAAKKKVAELFVLASRGPFNIDQWAGAAKSLVTLTRGAFSSDAALNDVGDAAAATGNDLEEVAGVVGDFYAAVRHGQPVGELTEKMQQMGIISAASAESLSTLADSGADVTDMARELSAALSINRGGMASLRNDLSGVNAGFEKARTTLQEKFGEPFTEAEIKNTRNYTDALLAIAPALGRVASFYQRLFGIFSTWFSSVTKAIAENDLLVSALEAMAKAVGIVVLAISGGAMVWLARLASGLIAAASASGLLTLALTTLGRATLLGLAVTAVAMLADKLLKLNGVIPEVEDASMREARAHDEARKAIEARIAAIKTLIDQQEALKEATDDVLKQTGEQGKLDAAARQEAAGNKGKAWKDAAKGAVAGALTGGSIGSAVPGLGTVAGALGGAFLGGLTGLVTSQDNTTAQEAAKRAREALAQRRKDVERVANKTGLISPAEQRQAELERQRDLGVEEAQLRLREARGEDPLKLGLQQLRVTRKRVGDAEAGVNATAEVERRRQADEIRIQEMRAAGRYGPPLDATEATKLDEGLRAPHSTAVFANTMVEKLEHAFAALDQTLAGPERARHATLAGGVQADPEMLAYWRKFAAQQKEQEDRLPDLAAQAKEQSAAIFERLQPIASSLARIGGGGNVADPLTGLAEEQRDLLRQILDELRGRGQSPDAPANVPNLEWGGASGLQTGHLTAGGLRTSHL